MKRYLVSADPAGWWCAGRRWPAEPESVPEDALAPEQWEELNSEPAITVEVDESDGSDLAPVDLTLEEQVEQLREELDVYASQVAERDARISELEASLAESTEQLNALLERDAPPGAGSDPAPARVPTREDRILAAARSLDPNNPKDWTQTGKAVILRLRQVSGLNDVTAAERDAAQAAAGVGPAAD